MKNNFQRQAKKMNDNLQYKDKELEEMKKRIRSLETQVLDGEKTNLYQSTDDLNQTKYKELKK